MSKVLVTGGTGFIAGHCIKLLLQNGYNVITTVRSDSKGKQVLDAHATESESGTNLRYHIVEDVAKAGAFDDAVKSTPDLQYVLHMASPFHYNVQDPIKDFLEPAITGSTSILKAIKDFAPGVKRVVLTSSFAALRNDAKPGAVISESSWNPVTWDEAVENTRKTYQGSKTLAERAAWEFIEKEKPNFDLVAVNPTLVFGPAAPHLLKGQLDSLNTSNVRILDMIRGKMKEKLDPTGFYTWVDVRDVALAHIKAMEVPEASGKRLFLISGYHTNKQIAHVIAQMNPDLKNKLPPDFEDMEDDIPPPGERYVYDNKQTREILGIKPTSFDVMVQDTVDSLVKLGA